MSALLRGRFGGTAGAKQPHISEVGHEDRNLPDKNLAKSAIKSATKSATHCGRSMGPQGQETDHTLMRSSRDVHLEK